MRILILKLSFFFAFSGLNAAHFNDKERDIEMQFYPILGIDVLCNYDLWEYRLHGHKAEINGPVIFRHVNGNEETTRYTGIILGEKPRQRVQITDGVKKRIAVKQVLEYKDLHAWADEMEKSLR